MQVPPIREDGLQLSEKRKFHRIFWTTERVAWIVFALILGLALLGLTGAGGYWSRITQTLPTGQVEYPRVTRWESTDEFRASFNGGAETHRLSLGYSFFENFEVEAIQPEPERTLTLPEGVVMEFAAGEGAPVNVIIHTRSLHSGLIDYRVALDGAGVEASILILP
ncbi:hypothetical protein [Chelativorans sp. J32]|uniref:hypothetical protein n=1 Tax=Chelativorans sp. J32 TaxID=935840 RepID=UPI0004AE04FB|nr:hypothetical protein [Chelativorans sp. J32]